MSLSPYVYRQLKGKNDKLKNSIVHNNKQNICNACIIFQISYLVNITTKRVKLMWKKLNGASLQPLVLQHSKLNKLWKNEMHAICIVQ